jgi:O-antigen ligase
MVKKQNRARASGFAPNTLLIFLSISLTMLALVMYPNTMDQYSLPKTTLLYISTLILIFLFVLKTVREKKVLIYRSILDIPVILFVVCAIVALIASDDPIVGLVGQYGRYEGLPSVICYAVIYFITVQTVRTEQHFEFLIKMLSVGFAPIAAYGVIQTTGLDFLTISKYGSRVHSTFGNPLIFGAYLVIMLPLLAGLARHSKEESWRMFSWFLLLLGIVNLIATESRGAWVGIIISVVVAGLIRLHSMKTYRKAVEANKGTKIRAGIISKKTVFVFLSVSILLIIMLFTIPGGRPIQRLTSAISISSDTVMLRLETWKSSLAMIKDRPLTGIGFEQMEYRFPAYETPKYASLAGKGVADRTHNDLLQVGVDAGIPAVLIYLWIVFIVAYKARENQRRFAYSATLTCAIVGYATQAQTGITSVFIGPIIWSLLGVTAAVDDKRKPFKVTIKQKTNLKPALYLVGLPCVALVALAFLPFVADQHVFRGQNKAYSNQGANSLGMIAPEFDTAMELFPYQNLYSKITAEFYINYSIQAQSSVFARTASFIAKKGLEYNKHDYELSYYVGEGYFLDYKISENDFSLLEAEKYFKLSQKLHPYYFDAVSRLLEIAIIRDDKNTASRLARKLVGAGIEDIAAYTVLVDDAKANGDDKTANKYLIRLKALTKNTSNPYSN